MGLKIEILCSSPDHPVNAWLRRWMSQREGIDSVALVHQKEELTSGDILFLISCTEIIRRDIRDRFSHSAVIHSSDLPEGRGWSPQVWAIVNGAAEIVVSALTADEPVDSGPIWDNLTVAIPPHALYDEINDALFEAWIELMTRVRAMVENGERPRPQPDRAATYWPRRTPADSELDPNASISSQFNLLRVCDPDRYPAYFHFNGSKYLIQIKKAPKGDDNLSASCEMQASKIDEKDSKPT